MAVFDKQLSRMHDLMGYRMPTNESRYNNVEYHTNGADGKVYGIIKEGTKYYIKTTEKGKENLSESYQYINGFNNRKENEYRSYNDASKHLELKMMSLNESYGIHEDVSTVDFNRSEKTYAMLTEEARKELDRLTQIMENSNSIGIKSNIGDHGNPEGKGKSTGADTSKNNKPFEDKKDEKLNKDSVESQTDPKKANSDYTDASKGVEKQLTSDKAPKKATDGGDPNKDYTLTQADLEGNAVAGQNPKGAKAVMVNEDFDFDEMPDEITFDDDISDGEFDTEEVGDDIVGSEEGIDGDEDDEFDTLMEEFDTMISGENSVMTGKQKGTMKNQTWDKVEDCNESNASESEEALKGPHSGSKALTWDKMNESQKKAIDTIVENVCKKICGKRKKVDEGRSYYDDLDDTEAYENIVDCPDCDWLRSQAKFPINDEHGLAYHNAIRQRIADLEGRDISNAYDDEDLDTESYENIVDCPDCKWLRSQASFPINDKYGLAYHNAIKQRMRELDSEKNAVNEAVKRKVNRIVKEEMTRLNAWGKHPRYGREPFTTPDNKEVMRGTADRDFNDDSAKNNTRYGKRIGKGKPFDQVVDILTNSVMSIIKESLTKKKR